MKKMNNKGFSLVELIIVIAIMAILIVVLAPQYLKYVERSRNSTDMQNATELKTAVETYVADPEATKAFVKDEQFKITISQNGGVVTTDVASGGVAEAISEAGLTIGNIKCSSKTAWDEYTVDGKVLPNGAIEWSYTSKAGSNTNTTFSDKMNNKTTSASS